jgi:hypothetical protein
VTRHQRRIAGYFFCFFFGTLLPARRASDSPIAIACLRLVTLRPELPLLSVPRLRFCIARSTLRPAPLLYLLAMRPPRRFSYKNSTVHGWRGITPVS